MRENWSPWGKNILDDKEENLELTIITIEKKHKKAAEKLET